MNHGSLFAGIGGFDLAAVKPSAKKCSRLFLFKDDAILYCIKRVPSGKIIIHYRDASVEKIITITK